MNVEIPQVSTRPLSVRIGRIIVRLALFGLVIWGVTRGYQAYVHHQRAQEIAPIHAYAQEIMVALKNGEYFGVQEHLEPTLQRAVSVDWLAYFSEHAELNATKTGQWGEWNSTQETNATLYHLSGQLIYKNGHKNPMQWEIQKEGKALYLRDLIIGKRSIKPHNSLAL